MTHALVTVISEIEANGVLPLAYEISKLGNPARDDVRAKLDAREGDSGTHFASLHAIPSGHNDKGYLVLEFSADTDGGDEEALARLVNAIGPELENIFKQAKDWDGSEKLLPYLQRRIVRVGHGCRDNPGVTFSGSPGMSVGRIWKECKLAARIAKILAAQLAYVRPIDRLVDVRDQLRKDVDYAWALELPEAPPLPPPPLPIVGLVLQALPSFVATYLWWPFVVGVLLVTLGVGIATRSWWQGLSALPMAAIVAGIVILAGLLILYRRLRRNEERDWVDERGPDRATLDEILDRENHYVQNHMVSLTRRKRGIVRWLTIRLVFWIVTQVVTRVYRPGFLGDIGSIHFARWVTVPNTQDFLFFSNYGGSWESYLEDFITRAHFGLTAIWSNSVGFPRSTNLIQGGASDGERFKRYARRSMLPTPFWYCAYPGITTAHIRLNASIRRGLAGAFSNDEAIRWLALFGSSQKPDDTLETNEIQSLVFGGLGFMPFSRCIFLKLGDDPDKAQRWLAPLLADIAFGDGRRFKTEQYWGEAVIIAGLGPGALPKLGLPSECVKGFPAPFLNGMASPARARVLGDVGDNAPVTWSWGRTPPDVVLFVFGPSADAVAILETKIKTLAQEYGQEVLLTIKLKEITKDKREGFGFVDGISQPTIRGTYKGMRQADSIHMVEPGEFVLGYPDNRGNTPPGPVLSPLYDPHNHLPIVVPNDDFATNSVNTPREIGRNGSFLVIRHLEQNADDFNNYCNAEAKRLKDRVGPPHIISPDLIAAKMIGRWRDGSSLVRHPYMSATDELKLQIQPSTLTRPKSDPANATPIEPPVKPDLRRENDFLLGEEDPEALRCPFGAHIRRANPRDSLDPGSMEQVDITNRHRLLRIGRFCEPEEGRKDGGLLFMCLNADIDRQFEFVQQTWLASSSFHGLVGEQDPVIGGGLTDATGFLIPTRDGPVRLNPLPRFVTTRGGGYFFLPGKRLLYFLAGNT